jgi:hypothetical protein
MSRTNYTGPVSFGENGGASSLDTRAYMPGRRVVSLSQASPSASIPIPAKSVVTKTGAVPTSAFTGTDPVSAMNVSFSNGTNLMAVVAVSAVGRYAESTLVSGAVFDSAGTIVVTLSAQSTTVFTGGGSRAFV